MKVLSVFGLVVAFCCVVPFARAQDPYVLGISTSVGYNERTYADMFKLDARVWKPNSSIPAPVDVNGMPRTDCDIFVLDGGYSGTQLMSGFQGTYKLSFNGKADFSGMGGTFQNVVYNAATNRTTADFVVTEKLPTIKFWFRNTQRAPASAKGTGLTALRLMRPVSIGSSTAYAPGTVFTNEYVALHKRGRLIRFMDFSATNGNIQQHWSDRRRPEELTYNSGQDQGYWWQGKGSPWEHAVLLCNLTNKDMWLNVPLMADDDYVRSLAALIHSKLNANLNVYVEYSNEIWNFGMPQWQQAQKLVDQDLASDPGSSINYDGTGISGTNVKDYSVLVPRYWARRVMQISDLFRSEFGDSAMMTRVRPLFETQAAWQHWISTGLLFLDGYYNNANGNHVVAPRPINAYLWGGGGSAYNHGFPDTVRNDPNLTVDKIFQGYAASWPSQYATMAKDVYWCSAFGLKRVAYEGGPGLDDFADPNGPVQTAQRDPRMRAVYRRQVDEFYRAGGDVYTTFMPVGVAHGLLPYDALWGSQPRPKIQAFDEIDKLASRPQPTVGLAVPGTFYGRRYHVCYDGWSTGAANAPVSFEDPYAWASYTIRATKEASYRIRLNLYSGSGDVRVELDGKTIGTLSLPTTGNIQTPSLSAGSIHGLRIVKTSGSFWINTVQVGDAAAPGAVSITATTGPDSAVVRWTPPSQGFASSYKIYRTTSLPITDATAPIRTGFSGTTFTDSGVVGGRTYYYAVRAVGPDGESSLSNVLTVTPTVRDHVVNGGFETGNANGWLGGGSSEVVSTGAHSGSYANQVNGQWASIYQGISTLAPNTNYTLTVWAKASNGNGDVKLYLKTYSEPDQVQTVTSTGYTKYTFSFKTGASVVACEIGAYEANGTSSAITTDDWQLVRTP